MIEVRPAITSDIKALSELSVRLGNIPLFPSQCKAALLTDDGEIIGFAAVQSSWHAAGSWVHEGHRKRGHSYELRHCLDNELRKAGIRVYFAIPQNDFERTLFAKYGHTTESVIQVRHL